MFPAVWQMCLLLESCALENGNVMDTVAIDNDCVRVRFGIKPYINFYLNQEFCSPGWWGWCCGMAAQPGSFNSFLQHCQVLADSWNSQRVIGGGSWGIPGNPWAGGVGCPEAGLCRAGAELVWGLSLKKEEGDKRALLPLGSGLIPVMGLASPEGIPWRQVLCGWIPQVDGSQCGWVTEPQNTLSWTGPTRIKCSSLVSDPYGDWSHNWWC